MDHQERQNFAKAITYKNNNSPDQMEPANGRPVYKRPANERPAYEKPTYKSPESINFDLRAMKESKDIYKAKPKTNQEGLVSAERLQEAVIWAEILDKPVSKRGKRR
jgi:hypothetical protein